MSSIPPGGLRPSSTHGSLVAGLLLAGLLLAACTGAPGGRGGPKGTDPGDLELLETTSYSDVTDRDGRLSIDVDVDAATTAFQITGEAALYVGLEELYDPDGNLVLYWEDWWTSPYSLTWAFFGFGQTTAFDWPIRGLDGTLQPGTWNAVFSVVDEQGYYVPDEPMDVAIAVKRDPDFADATVSVQIAWADGVDDDPAVVEAVAVAVERWREVWGAYGLNLEEHYVSTAIDPRLPFAYSGSDPEVEAAALSKGEGDLQVVIGEQVRNDGYTYGVSGGIPGTIEASPSTFVVISWLVHAGLDGAFDDDETSLMGETMAHEVGHYAGLFHPVESNYRSWDALDDTDDCGGPVACEEVLGKNVMFPYSICNGQSCVVTDEFTPDQAGVLHRYLGSL